MAELYVIERDRVFLTWDKQIELERSLGFPEEGIEPLETYYERRKQFIPYKEKREIIYDFLKSKSREDKIEFRKEWVRINLKSDEAKDYSATVLDYHFQFTKYGYLMRLDELSSRGDGCTEMNLEDSDPKFDPENYLAIVCRRRFFKKVSRFSTIITIMKEK